MIFSSIFIIFFVWIFIWILQDPCMIFVLTYTLRIYIFFLKFFLEGAGFWKLKEIFRNSKKLYEIL